MNLYLLLRMAILDIIIMVFLIVYNAYCSKYRKSSAHFSRMAVFSLLFCTFGLITEITVNSPTIPVTVNDILHIMYFTSGLAFCVSYFRYLTSLLVPANRSVHMTKYVGALALVIFIVMIFSDIRYDEGVGTRYSQGVGPTLGFSCALLLFVLTDILLIKYRNKVASSVLRAILPMSIMGTIMLVFQVIVPTFLFAESVMTLLSLGVFLAIENPVKKFESRAFMDIDTGTYNRNCFDEDIKKMEDEYTVPKSDKRIACVMCDINDLKYVNDTYGHLEGDKRIHAAASIILKELKGADKIYRVGGDEFIAFYKNNKIDNIKTEIDNVKSECVSISPTLAHPLFIAIGYYEKSIEDSIEILIQNADKAMYADKTRSKTTENDNRS